MKFLKRMWVNVPDQVVSTTILFLMVFLPIRGIISLFKNPPSNITIFVVIGVGVILGVLRSIPSPEQIEQWEKETKNKE